MLVQAQFTAHRKLDHGNPNLHNLRQDFERFDFVLDLAADPVNPARLMDLGMLNRWRNVARTRLSGMTPCAWRNCTI